MTEVSPNLNETQFMPVSSLMNMHSSDALARAGENPSDAATRMSAIAPAKNAEVDALPDQARTSMEGAIKGGTVDPVELSTDEAGESWIANGQKRIARAHAMGVNVLPVHMGGGDSADPLAGWDDL